jgi:DME family drug/metabolite transporter
MFNVLPSDKRTEWLGYVQVMLAATLWGAAGTLAKYVMGQAVSPMTLAEVRVTIAAGILLLVLLFKDRSLLRLKRQNVPYMIVLGIAGFAGVNYTYYYAISKTNVATAVLLQYTAPAFIMLFAVLFQGEPFVSGRLLALCLAFAGCFLMVGGYDLTMFETTKAGVVAALLSAGLFAFYSLYAEYGLKSYPVWTMLFYGFATAALFWWCLQPPWKIVGAHYPLRTWLFFISLGVFSTLAPFGLYFKGIRRIRATRASITGMLEPVVAGVGAYLFLDETMFPLQLVGAVLVFGGIFLLQIERQPRVIAERAILPQNFGKK